MSPTLAGANYLNVLASTSLFEEVFGSNNVATLRQIAAYVIRIDADIRACEEAIRMANTTLDMLNAENSDLLAALRESELRLKAFKSVSDN